MVAAAALRNLSENNNDNQEFIARAREGSGVKALLAMAKSDSEGWLTLSSRAMNTARPSVPASMAYVPLAGKQWKPSAASSNSSSSCSNSVALSLR